MIFIMSLKKINGGYSAEKAKEYGLDENTTFIYATTEVEEKREYDKETKSYGDVIAHVIYVATEFANPFPVKLPVDVVPGFEFGEKIKLDNLQCCEVSRRPYFKADDVKGV